MHLTSALAASAWALQASAFLVPLQATSPKSAISTVVFSESSSPFDLDCPHCPYFTADGSPSPNDVRTKIHLEFGIDTNQELTVNGHSPFSKNQPLALTARQIRLDDGQLGPVLDLDFALEKLPAVNSHDTPDLSVTPLRLTILALQGHPVKADTVSISLLASPEQTSIAVVSTLPFKDSPGAPTCNTASNWAACRYHAIVMAGIKARPISYSVQGSFPPAKPGCHMNSGSKSVTKGAHHRHHYHAHHLGRLLHQTLRFFVIPALLGVIGGLVASAIGMLVGQLIVFVWVRFYRGDRRGEAHGRVVEIVVEEDEKDTLLAGEDIQPPLYEYVTAEEKANQDEKKP
ncbi:hypothetical protein B0A52_10199 [Exophiala mesophila]|uniref:Uncharacterized protein n=1 Tax=Exophiala mesophila TaxID=212818 RepID=A0A438MSU1_EXOME|nr:hypothetical protein B0A52_10199 [Exophiala mesophila]